MQCAVCSGARGFSRLGGRGAGEGRTVLAGANRRLNTSIAPLSSRACVEKEVAEVRRGEGRGGGN